MLEKNYQHITKEWAFKWHNNYKVTMNAKQTLTNTKLPDCLFLWWMFHITSCDDTASYMYSQGMTLPITCTHKEWHCRLHVLTRKDTVSYMYSQGMTLSVTCTHEEWHCQLHIIWRNYTQLHITMPVTYHHKEWHCQLHVLTRNETVSYISSQGMTLPVTYHCKEWHCQ